MPADFALPGHCPFVKHVNPELARLGRDYAGSDLAIVAISRTALPYGRASVSGVHRTRTRHRKEALYGAGAFITLGDAQSHAGKLVPAAQKPSIGCNVKWTA